MSYKAEVLASDRLWTWEDDDFFLLTYHPYRSSGFNDTSRMILDFKENKSEAVRISTELIKSALKALEAEFRDERRCMYALALPPSTAGKINKPCEYVCQALSRTFGWPKYLPKALTRTKSVQKSARAAPGERPDYDAH